MKSFITGVFDDRVSAEAAVNQLTQLGFGQQDITVLMSDQTRAKEFGVTNKTKAPEGAAAGATAGGVIGAIVAGLIAVGSIAVPGGILVTGPLVAALAGAGVGGAAGTLVGALVGAGIPEHEAKALGERIKTGGILVGVHAEGERADYAKKVLKAWGAEGIKTEHVRGT
jgi:uncharacterized membrane protein